jgi:N-formylglutamate deformylase
VRPPYEIAREPGRLVAVALHAGHDLRPEVADLISLDDSTRRREEDPGTDRVTAVAPVRIVVHRSRFEVDLNRPRDQAVYRRPEDAWGLTVWRRPPPDTVVGRSLAIYDEFYRAVATEFEALAAAGPFLVLDVHSYNHRRDARDRTPADVAANPEVNIGTGTLDRDRWGPTVDRFMERLRQHEVDGHDLDVRENVRFRGGHFSSWTHDRYPEVAVALAIELKKTYMDEWTGRIDSVHLDELRGALETTAHEVVDQWEHVP